MAAPSSKRILLGAAIALALPLTGCVVAPAPYGYYGEPVYAAPPPPQVEYAPPPPPAVGWLWIGGYWTWRASRHVWIGGHWEAPRPGYRYVPHEWQRDGRGWRERPGYWDRR